MLIATSSCCLIAPPVEPPQTPGKFVGRVAAVWLDDGREMKLLEDFVFIDSTNFHWLAVTGSGINGASIPQALWSVVGSPYTGLYRYASVVHDVACDRRSESWESVHTMFYEACLAGGVHPETAELMYAAVYRWGPRWKPQPVRGSLNPSESEVRALQEQLRDLRRAEGMLSPQRIRQFIVALPE